MTGPSGSGPATQSAASEPCALSLLLAQSPPSPFAVLQPQAPMAKQKKQAVQRQRRSVDQKIADLTAKIVALKEREARKQAKADPALRHASAALKSVDKALAEAKDLAMRKALTETRSALCKCLELDAG